MQVIIQSPQVTLENKLKELITGKFGNLGKIYDRIIKCRVLLKKEPGNRKNNFAMEVTLLLPGARLFAHDSAETFEIAMHAVIDNITRQLNRHKDKQEEIW